MSTVGANLVYALLRIGYAPSMTQAEAHQLLHACLGPDYRNRVRDFLDLLTTCKPIHEQSPIRGSFCLGDGWLDVTRAVAHVADLARDDD